MKDPSTTQDSYWDIYWWFVFAANLILTLNLGWMVTAEGGRIGMAAGIVSLGIVGYRLCVRYEAIGRALVLGGGIVALSQLVPLLQFTAGSLGLSIASGLHPGPSGPKPIRTELGGFIATITTGGLLMGVAALFGVMVSSFFPALATPKHVARSPLHDPQLDG